MKPSTVLLFAGLLCTAIASAHQCGCSRHRNAKQPSTDFDIFSSSTLNELAALRADASLGQEDGMGAPRIFSHQLYTDSSGRAEQITRRQLGDRAVTERKVGGKVARELHNIDDDELTQFEQEWRHPAERLSSDQPKQLGHQARECVRQEHADGATVDVMLLQPDERTSDEWMPVAVKRMSCAGKYQLVTPEGEPVTAALATGIEHKHLRTRKPSAIKPAAESEEQALQRKLAAAEKQLTDAKQAVTAAKAARQAEQQRLAKLEQARKRLLQVDAEIKAAAKAQAEGRKRVEAAMAEKASLAAVIGNDLNAHE